MSNHQIEVQSGDRFEFGKNWGNYVEGLDSKAFLSARQSFQKMLELRDLTGQSFIDVGCGSGIVSLIAKEMGAEVLSFDYDPNSVHCTEKLKEKFFPKDQHWQLKEGSILDQSFVSQLGQFDIVYSWGVLHHTGKMWDAIKNASSLCKNGGIFFLAIYNYQGWPSSVWLWIKKMYNKSTPIMKKIILFVCFIRLWGPTILKDFIKLRPFHTYLSYSKERGMSPITDVIDWVGGYPFEVARPEEIFLFLRENFDLMNLKTCLGGHGCNEFVFRRKFK